MSSRALLRDLVRCVVNGNEELIARLLTALEPLLMQGKCRPCVHVQEDASVLLESLLSSTGEKEILLDEGTVKVLLKGVEGILGLDDDESALQSCSSCGRQKVQMKKLKEAQVCLFCDAAMKFGDGQKEELILLATRFVEGSERATLKDWSKFCESCFSFKENPPSALFFFNKAVLDPVEVQLFNEKGEEWANRRNILVKRDTTSGEIIATLKVFVRRLHWMGSDEVLAGGVGEVCTSAQHQRRGHSRDLLHKALEQMKKKSVRLAFLHAGEPGPMKLYESVGFRSIPTEFYVIHPLPRVSRPDSNVNQVVNLETIAQAAEVYRFTPSFSGKVKRSKEFWFGWVLNAWASQERSFLRFLKRDDQIFAFAFLFEHNGRLKIGDFGARGSLHESELLHLVGDCEEPICVPTTLIGKLALEHLGFHEMQKYVDPGWMYLFFDSGLSTSTSDHLILPTDGF